MQGAFISYRRHSQSTAGSRVDHFKENTGVPVLRDVETLEPRMDFGMLMSQRIP